MRPTREEHLERLSRHRRSDPPDGRRRRTLGLAVVGLVVVALFAVGGWWALGRVAPSEAGAGSVVAQLEAWFLARREADLAPVGGDGEPVAFEIVPGEGLPAVAERLEAAGLIRSASTFLLFARVQGLDRSVQAGRHTLAPGMSAQEILTELQLARGEAIAITIPEGLRAEEVAALLEGNRLVDGDELLQIVASGARTGRPAVDARPDGAGLEGYLFPETYEFEPDAGAQAVTDRMLDTFEARLSPALREAAAAAGLTVHEVVTLASIVEREAVVEDERPTIARVYLNRLSTPPYLLNADPTVQYGLGFQADAATWWKRPLYTEDLAVDGPYNTYTRPGLPAGPIASPGLASIEAVLDPAEGPWQYFVANDVACDGTHVFANTFDEHLANIARYQTGDCGR